MILVYGACEDFPQVYNDLYTNPVYVRSTEAPKKGKLGGFAINSGVG